MLRSTTITIAVLLTFAAGAADEVRPPAALPRAALEQCVSGEVKLEITFGAAGTVRSARVLESTPKELFDKAALESVRRWRLDPVQHPEGSKDVQVVRFEIPRELCPKKA